MSCHGFNWGWNNVDLGTEKVSHFEKLEGKSCTSAHMSLQEGNLCYYAFV